MSQATSLTLYLEIVAQLNIQLHQLGVLPSTKHWKLTTIQPRFFFANLEQELLFLHCPTICSLLLFDTLPSLSTFLTPFCSG